MTELRRGSDVCAIILSGLEQVLKYWAPSIDVNECDMLTHVSPPKSSAPFHFSTS